MSNELNSNGSVEGRNRDENENDETKETEGEPEEADPELEAMKRRVKEIEEESEKIKEIQSQVFKEMSVGVDKEEVDARSIYVGNVDYGASPEELQAHFQSCGTINRVTILCDKFTGHPKGFAYIEFLNKDSLNNAMILNESLFRGRQIKVVPKRTNVPGLVTTPRGTRAAYLGRPGRFYAPRRPRGRRFHPYM